MYLFVMTKIILTLLALPFILFLLLGGLSLVILIIDFLFIEYWYITVPLVLLLFVGAVYLFVQHEKKQKIKMREERIQNREKRLAREKHLAEEEKRKAEEEKREAEKKEREEIRRRLILEKEVREELEAEQKNSKNKK